MPSPAGGPLGRNVEHDERSRRFQVVAARGRRDRVIHKRHGKILDQGNIGSCTGNALEGALGCDPLHHWFERHTEKKAVKLYSRATALDEFPGVWEPDDTGSSGLAVCKAGVELGRLSRYEHAFGVEQALDALQDGPVITGIDWYEGFDNPDPSGRVTIGGQIRGGHEIVARAYLPVPGDLPIDGLVKFDNSWGRGWGLNGSFLMTARTWATLLEAEGDVTVPIR